MVQGETETLPTLQQRCRGMTSSIKHDDAAWDKVSVHQHIVRPKKSRANSKILKMNERHAEDQKFDCYSQTPSPVASPSDRSRDGIAAVTATGRALGDGSFLLPL